MTLIPPIITISELINYFLALIIFEIIYAVLWASLLFTLRCLFPHMQHFKLVSTWLLFYRYSHVECSDKFHTIVYQFGPRIHHVTSTGSNHPHFLSVPDVRRKLPQNNFILSKKCHLVELTPYGGAALDTSVLTPL